MSYNAIVRAKQNRAGGLYGQDRGWDVGSNQGTAIGIPARLVRKINERTTPINYDSNGEKRDDRNLVVQQNTLSGVGRYRSQFNVDADGIKPERYYLGDKDKDAVAPSPPPPIVSGIWTVANGPQFDKYGYGVYYANNVWIAVGHNGDGVGNTILRSTDGMTWASPTGTSSLQFPLAGYGVHYADGVWVAVGDNGGAGNTILVSNDHGVTCLPPSGPGSASFTRLGRHVHYADGFGLQSVATAAAAAAVQCYSQLML